MKRRSSSRRSSSERAKSASTGPASTKAASNSATPVASPLESTTADRVTTAWMMALLATLLAEAAGMVTSWLGRHESPAGRWTALAELALFVACTTGLVSLGLMLAALKLRRIRAPRAIVLVSIVASLLPWLAVLLRPSQ